MVEMCTPTQWNAPLNQGKSGNVDPKHACCLLVRANRENGLCQKFKAYNTSHLGTRDRWYHYLRIQITAITTQSPHGNPTILPLSSSRLILDSLFGSAGSRRRVRFLDSVHVSSQVLFNAQFSSCVRIVSSWVPFLEGESKTWEKNLRGW